MGKLIEVSPAHSLAGFSMLELLIAMLVTGVGVLGVTGLGALTQQQSRAAAAHADAVLLTHDVMERIRANPAGVAAGAYGVNAPPTAQDCVAGPCSPGQMGAFDLSAWRCALGAAEDREDCMVRLNAQGELRLDPASGAMQVSIRWSAGGAMRMVVVGGRG